MAKKLTTKTTEVWADYFEFVEENGMIIRKFIVSVKVPCEVSFRERLTKGCLGTFMWTAGVFSHKDERISLYDFMLTLTQTENFSPIILSLEELKAA